MSDNLSALDKMTVKDLRNLALQVGNILGVHAMKKEELLEAIKEAKGITEDSTVDSIRAEANRRLKTKMGTLRTKKEEAREAGDKKTVKTLQRRINRLKKRTRKAA